MSYIPPIVIHEHRDNPNTDGIIFSCITPTILKLRRGAISLDFEPKDKTKKKFAIKISIKHGKKTTTETIQLASGYGIQDFNEVILEGSVLTAIVDTEAFDVRNINIALMFSVTSKDCEVARERV